MDNLAQNEEPTPKRRGGRRKMVQSTLFPLKSPEIDSGCGDLKECEVDGGDNEGDLDNCSGSQGKKTRKRKGKAKPQETPPKKKKSPAKKTTPKTTGKSSTKLMQSEKKSPLTIPNLRLEAKLTAEENSRLFAGKQVHPFFSSWKVGKQNEESNIESNSCLDQGKPKNNVESNGCSDQGKPKKSSIGPIHVFGKTPEEVVSLDWKNWTFCKETFTGCVYPSESAGKFSSLFEGSAESLKFNKSQCGSIPDDLLTPSEFSSVNCFAQEHLSKPLLRCSVGLTVKEDACCQYVNSSCEDHQRSVGQHSSPVVPLINFDEEKNVLHQESNGANQPENNIWIEKYQPKTAMEICGNNQSVKFIRDWLHDWRQRDIRGTKGPFDCDKSSMRETYDDCCETNSDSENVNGDSLKNVLLVRGPVGSGKSTAIQACALENGYKVLENNASDCRNGALVKQKFGEALESRWLTRSLRVDSFGKNIIKSTPILCTGEVVQDTEIIDIQESDDETNQEIEETYGKVVCKERVVNNKSQIKPLILFEDVDITFTEDRGFIGAVKQIAEKAKGPVILTCSSKDIILPDNLDRLEVSFDRPSSNDLVSLLYMICKEEKVAIQPHLIEQLVAYCWGDIRKAILHLQFWCQGERHGQDNKMQNLCGSMDIDPIIGHQLLPKIIFWNFSSSLSELVEKEISTSLSLMEENTTLPASVVKSEGHNENEDEHNSGVDFLEAKKEAMLSRNHSIHASNKFVDPSNTVNELTNLHSTQIFFGRRKGRKKLNVVMSSDSEDGLCDDGLTAVANNSAHAKLFLEDDSRFPSQFSNAQSCFDRLNESLFHAEKCEKLGYPGAITNDLLMDGACRSTDLSFVPESSYVPETEIDNGVELSANVVESVEVSVSKEFFNNPIPGLIDNKSTFQSCRLSDHLEDFGDVSAESSQTVVLEDSQNEHVGAMSRGYQVLDECSRMEIKKRSKTLEKFKSYVAIDLVKESWKKLRGNDKDLKQYVDSESSVAFQAGKLVYGMCKLISEADLLLSKYPDSKSSMFPCEESIAFDWWDGHVQMTSTMLQHGFCSYGKYISAIGHELDSKEGADLTWQKISSMARGIALGESIRISNVGIDLNLSPPESEILLSRDLKSHLFESMKSLVPKKSHLALKGVAFHEYSSSLSLISRSETARLSQCVDKTKRRRSRGARHYLSTGSLMLSPEDTSLLSQSNLYRKS